MPLWLGLGLRLLSSVAAPLMNGRIPKYSLPSARRRLFNLPFECYILEARQMEMQSTAFPRTTPYVTIEPPKAAPKTKRTLNKTIVQKT